MPNGVSDESGIKVDSITGQNRGRPSTSKSREPLTGNMGPRGDSEIKAVRMKTRVQSDPGKSGPR